MSEAIRGVDVTLGSIGSGSSAPLTGSTGGADSTASAPASGGDSVQIGNLAARLAGLEQSLRSAPVVDEARVAQVQHALDTGNYATDTDKIATRLLSTERALAGL
jgi:negative regulator of flagellin synthesis FlgM